MVTLLVRFYALPLLISGILVLPPGSVRAFTVDFDSNLAGAPLENGQSLQSFDFGGFFTLSGSGQNLGPAAFETCSSGLKAGNILILQSSERGGQSTPGFFDQPLASNRKGRLVFDFDSPVELLSIDLVDHNRKGDFEDWVFTLFREDGGKHIFTLEDCVDCATPSGGVLTLRFGDEGKPKPDFGATDITALQIDVQGSGGVDNLRFSEAPEPVALALLALAGCFARAFRS